MIKETKPVQQNAQQTYPLDQFDRKILGALVADARQSYADIGRIANLSAPAVHERVKRMKASGVISDMQAILDGGKIGKPFLAFVHVDADGWGKSQRMIKLSALPEVEEMHSVAGDTCVIIKVRTASAQALEEFLSQLYVLPGIKGTKSFVVLSTYLERPVQAEITDVWPNVPLPTRVD